MKDALFWVAVVITLAPFVAAVLLVAWAMGWWSVPAAAWLVAVVYVAKPPPGVRMPVVR